MDAASHEACSCCKIIQGLDYRFHVTAILTVASSLGFGRMGRYKHGTSSHLCPILQSHSPKHVHASPPEALHTSPRRLLLLHHPPRIPLTRPTRRRLNHLLSMHATGAVSKAALCRGNVAEALDEVFHVELALADAAFGDDVVFFAHGGGGALST